MRSIVQALIMMCAILLTAKLAVGQVQLPMTGVTVIDCKTLPAKKETHSYPASKKLEVELDKKFVTAVNIPLVFKNIDDGTEYKADGSGKYQFDNIFDGIDATITQQTFRLIDVRKHCYDHLLIIERNTDTLHEKDKPKDPHLAFPSPVTLPSQCESCAPNKRLVIYNFKDFTLKTKWDSTEKQTSLYKSKKNELPRVGRDFTFQVRHVNPFRFNITIADERFDYNTDIPKGLVSAFALGATEALKQGNIEAPPAVNFEDEIVKLGGFVHFQIGEFQNTSDCFDPCETVANLNNQIIAYFITLGYHTSEPLEEFLARKLNLDREPADDDDKDLIKRDKAILSAYSKFRRTGQATVNYLIPQVQNVDEYVFQLNITPVDGVKTGNRVLNQEIVVPVLGGFKVDFSTGLFVSGLSDSKYSLRSDSMVLTKQHGGDSIRRYRKQVMEEKSPGQSFGVTSLIHGYYRASKYFNLGGSLGVGLKIGEKTKLQYLVGVSALIGRSNRLIITGGGAFGYVDRLSNKYLQDGGSYYTSWTDTSVEMRKILKGSWFVSLTYNIPLGKKQKIVSIGAAAGGGDKDDKKDDDK